MIPASPLLLLAALYCLLNGTAFLLYARDKRKAKAGGRRTPERVLLAIAVFGPFGALFAMRVFRHKTRKPKFLLVPAVALLHAACIAWVLLRLLSS
jgi:uncharacterized membrane protein YsdA (DUF1294 family)